MVERHHKLDDEALRALLAAARPGQSPHLRPGNEAEDYDVYRPHRFTPPQRERLGDFAEITTRRLTGMLSAQLRGPFPVTLLDLQQEYAGRGPDLGSCYYLPLQVQDRLVGTLIVPVASGIKWVTKMLGGMIDEKLNLERTLSGLETDLLLDICNQVVEGFNHAGQEFQGPGLSHPGKISRDVVDLSEEKKIIECCRLAFVSESLEGVRFDIVLLLNQLEPVAGHVPPPDIDSEEAYRRMLHHVERVPMNIRVRLDSAEVTLRDAAAFEPGDVLLLGTRVGEPIDMIVSGKEIMVGLPVQYQGRYALQILDYKQDD
jgi:flagellar motor switch protein FliM